MIRIKLIREIKGKELIQQYEKLYSSLEELKKVFNQGKGDMKLKNDLKKWEYFLQNPEEETEQEIMLYDENPSFSMTDLKIIDLIKNEKPDSISELANLMNKDVGNIAEKVTKLKEKGFVELKEGNIDNTKAPLFNYDKIEIAI